MGTHNFYHVDSKGKSCIRSQFLDEMCKVKHELIETSQVLYKYADAHYTLGNKIMADELSELASIISENVEKIENTVHNKITEDLGQAWQNSANMIRSALTATKLKEG